MRGWTRWSRLEPALPWDAESLLETLEEGQAFRWWSTDQPGRFRGCWSQCVAELRSEAGYLQWRAPKTCAQAVLASLPDYLGLDRPLEARRDALPWRSDPVLAKALALYPGLRLLNQPLEEVLLFFLLSSNKHIKQIKRIVESIATTFGPQLYEDIHGLPGWESLAGVDEAAIRALGAGYRARFICGSATELAARPSWQEELRALPYAQARAWLMELPGVGGKIADCVLLYSGLCPEAFPVDTWIDKCLREAYALEDFNREQIAHFGRVHFGADAGLAQQYLFAAKRRGKL